jgi:FixJ family two-component response regulator
MTVAVPLIAVVDDEAPVRTALGRLLRLADYEVAAFGSGEDFLASLAARKPACVILDVHMPGLSGLAVQSRLRAMHIEVPAIYITASDDLELDRSVREAGGARLLRKPFSNDELLAAVGAVLVAACHERVTPPRDAGD